jgi:sugar fermentation stimulation protein A
MRLEAPLLEARFKRRYQRFFVECELPSGELVTAHCANTGSLAGCLEPGAAVWLRDSQDDQRKLRYSFQAIRPGSAWVNVDTSLPNAVVAEAIPAGLIPELGGYASLRREVRYGVNSRIDLLLEGHGRPPCYVEVKNTTLARDLEARFPDAVTERGRKHLSELTEVVRQGGRGVQFFFVSRGDVQSFAPADDIDPAYGRALRDAAAAGVELLAYAARVTPQALEVERRLPIRL